ncbi:MAG: ATP-binding protein [Candidatus Aminicenantales bacterium]
MKVNVTLNRQMFELSRELEFFTEKELMMQIGHPKSYWRISLLKELIDNSLDACEVSDIKPEITVEDTEDHFSVTDNGPGLPFSTIKKSLDYMVRISDKQYYVSPTRGQMGNALKTVWAAPFVALGEGEVTVESRGKRHVIKTSLDRIMAKPQMDFRSSDGPIKNGTKVSVRWPLSSRLQDEKTSDSYNSPESEEDEDGLPRRASGSNYDGTWPAEKPDLITSGELIAHYALFNPHATFHFNGKSYPASVATWAKWRTDNPTSAHWYNEFQLRDLIAAYLLIERKDKNKAKTVREFVTEFRGLSGTAKGAEIIKGFKGTYLHDLMKNGDVDMAVIKKLLQAMRDHSKPVKPYQMGLVGGDHLKGWAAANIGVVPESFQYGKCQGVDATGLPYTQEALFALKSDTEKAHRSVITGLNWSPTIGDPVEEISEAVGSARIGRDKPVLLIIHMIQPRFAFTNRGKTRLSL